MKNVSPMLALYELEYIFIYVLQIIIVLINMSFDIMGKIVIINVNVRTHTCLQRTISNRNVRKKHQYSNCASFIYFHVSL